MFANMGVLTLNRKIITANVSNKIDAEPEPISFKLNMKNRLMFAVGILRLNLSDPSVKFFDIRLR